MMADDDDAAPVNEEDLLEVSETEDEDESETAEGDGFDSFGNPIEE